MSKTTLQPPVIPDAIALPRRVPEQFSKLLSAALKSGKAPSRHELRVCAALDVEEAVLNAEASGAVDGKDAYAGALALAKIRTQQLAMLSPLMVEQTGHNLDALLSLVEAAPERTGPTDDLHVTVRKRTG